MLVEVKEINIGGGVNVLTKRTAEPGEASEPVSVAKRSVTQASSSIFIGRG